MAEVPGQSRIIITGEFNRRWRVAGDDLDGSITSAGLSCDFYFDDGQKVALGITHDRGELPKANFVKQRRTYISFRVKI